MDNRIFFDTIPVKRVYLTGIKGIAMAAFAAYLHDAGVIVGGSDTKEHFPSDSVVKSIGIIPDYAFEPKYVGEFHPDALIYTGAHGGRDNPQVREALRLKIPVFPHGMALGKIMDPYRQICVSGCHGKTTTSAMTAVILRSSGLDPSYAIGCGEIFPIGLPGHKGTGEWFVAESDEYMTDPVFDPTPRFLWQKPDILAVTNIGYDHPDAYKDIHTVKHAFMQLAKRLRGKNKLVYNFDDPENEIWKNHPQAVSVGVSKKAEYQISGIRTVGHKTVFTLKTNGESVQLQLLVPGMHNVHNASIAVGVAHLTGLSLEQISKGLLQFTGTKRRFEKIGHVNGIEFLDDYAHHPDEIIATLTAARQWYPKNRIISVFQPHTYSRTQALLKGFIRAFDASDEVIITGIYASARENRLQFDISGEILAKEIGKIHTNVHYADDAEAVKYKLRERIKPGDVVIFFGAGDIYTWGRSIVKELS